MNAKIEKLRSDFGENLDAGIIFSDENILYFTGFAVTDACLFITKNSVMLYTDSRYSEAAASVLGEDCVTDCRGRMFDFISEHCKREGIACVGVEQDRITLALYNRLAGKIPDVKFDGTSAFTQSINKVRKVKFPEEIVLIQKAQDIAELAFDYILGEIKPGATEKEVALKLDYFMLSHGADALSFDTICVSGAKTSLPHGVPGEKVIEKGDFITMDFGAVYKGYHSDMTRTVGVGAVSDEQKKVYNTVLEAQLSALGYICAGKKASDCDAAARNIIEKAGYGQYFGHSTGHGVGVEIHELPNVGPRSEGVLEVANIVTVEPGIYLPGRFGVRIEDMVCVTETGCMNFTKCPKELIEL